MALPPYKPAKLVNDDKPLNSKTQRWYIEFSAWNAATGKLTRRRLYLINNYKTRSERLAYAKKTIKAINDYLAEGYHINPKKKQAAIKSIYTERDKDFRINEAFEYIMPIVKKTKRHATYNSYNNIRSLFINFCDAAGWTDWKIRTLTRVDIINWLDYLQSNIERPVGNNTRNKYLSYLSAMFSMMVERNVLKENVCLGIKMLSFETSGHTAYTSEEIPVLKAALQAHNPRLWSFVTFMLYGFIRPAEIGRLRIGMINLQGNYILMPGTITKNKKPRKVIVSPAFKSYIEELELDQYRTEHYVFGYGLKPGPHPIQKNYANQQHVIVLRDLGYSSAYTLYSWKHTGVVIHYRAGVDIKTLQAQLGHQSLHETDVYLRSLHLYESTEMIDKSPAI